MEKYPMFKDWYSKIELVNQKLEDNPLGKLELAVQLDGAAFGSVVEPEEMKISLGGESPDFFFNDRGIMNKDLRHLYTEHKREFNDLLNLATTRVEERLKQTDTVLFSLVKPFLPAITIKRMEGNRVGMDIKSILRVSVEEKMKEFYIKYSAVPGQALVTFDLRNEIQISSPAFKYEKRWKVVMDSNSLSVNNGERYFLSCNSKKDGSILQDTKSLELVMFILYQKEIEDIVDKFTHYLELSKKL